MIVDLDDGYWTDNYDSDSELPETGIITTFILGFSPVIEIMYTKYAKDGELCNNSGTLDDRFRYVAVFNGYGNTIDEINSIYESNFTEFPIPQLFPIVVQSNSLDKVKKGSIKYIEMQWGASKLSKSDLRVKMENEDKILVSLLDKYMNMFTYKNLLN